MLGLWLSLQWGGILGSCWDPGQCSTCEPRAELCGHQPFLQVLISPGVRVCIYRETWFIFKLSHFKVMMAQKSLRAILAFECFYLKDNGLYRSF